MVIAPRVPRRQNAADARFVIARAAVRDVSKIELHLHLEGSLRPSSVTDMARRHDPTSRTPSSPRNTSRTRGSRSRRDSPGGRVNCRSTCARAPSNAAKSRLFHNPGRPLGLIRRVLAVR